MSPKTTLEKRFPSTTELIQSMHERQQETPIHQVDTPLGLSGLPSRSQPSKQAVQPPLPPPPNPQYLESAATADETPEVTESPTTAAPNLELAETSAPDAPDAEETPETLDANPLYEVQTEGPLTYYNYYFEEMGTIVPDTTEDPSSRSKMTVGLVGAGVVAATVVSGLVIGDAWHKSQAPAEGQPKNTSLKQDSAKNFTRTPSVTPERQEVERSPLKPRAVPSTQPKAKLGKTSFLQSPSQPETQPLPPPAPVAAPESLAATPFVPPQPARPTPTPAQPQKPSAWVAANIPQVSVRAAARQAALSPVARPETLPIDPLNSPQGTSLPPENVGSNSVREALPASSIDAANSEQTTQLEVTGNAQPGVTMEPANSANPTQNSLTTTQAPGNEEKGLQQLFPMQQSETGMGTRSSITTPSSTAPQAATVNPTPSTVATQKIQEYLDLPKNLPPTRTVSLMPLSEQAAIEATGTAQVGEFAIRQVNSQEYQKEWATSNKTDDPMLANAFPAYGFIDYQRRVIVVLQQKSPAAPVQSQGPIPPSS